VLIVYSFGFGFPTALHFIIKFLGGSKLSLPEVILHIIIVNLSLWLFIQLLYSNIPTLYNPSSTTSMDINRIWYNKYNSIFNNES
jgi:hypothetical protein